jgi:CO/xanthine dehydrogenase Mo-binding subunit
VIVEVPNLNHPFGVKGVGEITLCPIMAAVANAVTDATKRRMMELPM